MYYYGNKILFISYDRRAADDRLEIVDVVEGTVESKALDPEFLNQHSLRSIFGTDTAAGRRFWLFTRRNPDTLFEVFRLWEDGEVESVGESLYAPFYVNGMLLTFSEKEFLFSRMDKGFRLFRDEARVRVNPDDAQQNGWEEAMPVQVESQSGTFSGVLKIDERVTPGTVAAAYAPFRFTDNRMCHVFPVRLKRGT